VDWKVFNTSNSPLPADDVRALAIDGDGNKWIGTYFGGLAVYKEISVGINDFTKGQGSDISCVLEQNYPNPFTKTTTITWQQPEKAHVILKVYDFTGREIKTLVDENEAPGEHQVTFNAAGLPAGVYFYQIRAGYAVETKKMILAEH